MSLIDVIQEIIGISGHGEIAAERGVFQLPSWYVGLKAVLAGVAGVMLVWMSVVRLGMSGWERVVVLAVGMTAIGIGVSIARSAKRITVAEGVVAAEFMGGRRESWPIWDLEAQAPSGLGVGRGAVWVRVRSTGKVAFVVPRDMPAWEVLVASITEAPG